MTTPLPPYARDWDLLAACAADLLDGRVRFYPQLVAEGKLSQAKADDGIRIIAAVAADWRRIAALCAAQPAAPRDRTATPAEKVHALESAVASLKRTLAKVRAESATLCPADATIADLARMAGEGGVDVKAVRKLLHAIEKRDLAAALLWHARRDDAGSMLCAEVTAEHRDRARSAAKAA